MLEAFFQQMMSSRLDWIQVEVTSYCNAACSYCPRTLYRDAWLNRHMPMSIFEKLALAFPKTRLVFLQGWGEPFLHPGLRTMISLAKQAGCRVGTTTNGMLLDENSIRELIHAGLDILAISLAGTDEKNDVTRKKTSLKKILESVQMLAQAKAQMNAAHPKVHIAYMLLRSGLQDVEKLPRMLQGLGISDIVISTLDFVPHVALAAETIMPSTADEYKDIQRKMDLVRENGLQYGLNIHHQVFNPENQRVTCTENIQNSMFISADGNVSACVFTNLPVSGEKDIYQGDCRKYQRLVFGNIKEENIASIWRQKTFREFRKGFYKKKYSDICRECPKLFVGP